MIPGFYKYFKKKSVPASSFNNNDVGLKDDIKSYLDQTFRASFRKRWAFQTWMLGQNELNDIADNSFDMAVAALSGTPGKLKIDNKIFWEQRLSDSGRMHYLRQLLALWYNKQDDKRPDDEDNSSKMASGLGFNYRVKSSALAALDQMERTCRNYFIWQYMDHFTLEQIIAVAAVQPEALMKQLWDCFQSTERICSRMLALPVYDKCTEDQYYLLCTYFNNRLTDNEEAVFIDSVQQERSLQHYFQFLLSLNYETIGAELTESVNNKNSSVNIKADELISLVKNELESPDK